MNLLSPVLIAVFSPSGEVYVRAKKKCREQFPVKKEAATAVVVRVRRVIRVRVEHAVIRVRVIIVRPNVENGVRRTIDVHIAHERTITARDCTDIPYNKFN